jgi:hypothetical protein
MSSSRKNQTPLTYVLQHSWLIGVNEGNERDKSLITLQMSRVALAFLIIVPVGIP